MFLPLGFSFSRAAKQSRSVAKRHVSRHAREIPATDDHIPEEDSSTSRSLVCSSNDESAMTPPPRIMMLSTLYRHVTEYLISQPVEDGGLLIGPKGHGLITHFVLD